MSINVSLVFPLVPFGLPLETILSIRVWSMPCLTHHHFVVLVIWQLNYLVQLMVVSNLPSVSTTLRPDSSSQNILSNAFSIFLDACMKVNDWHATHYAGLITDL